MDIFLFLYNIIKGVRWFCKESGKLLLSERIFLGFFLVMCWEFRIFASQTKI